MPDAAVSWNNLKTLLGFSPPTTRTPMPAAKFGEVSKNVVVRTPQRPKSLRIGGGTPGPHANSAIDASVTREFFSQGMATNDSRQAEARGCFVLDT